ncbi:glycosyltransferase [Flavobacterium sp.]|uniref:glycosyltransferase n=1 Tax=Flavobacterium sp. TaxID=239 RepID=UPI003D12246B
MKKKILIIPSWYPNVKNDIVGSFFQEQAAFLSNNGYDIKVLYGNVTGIGYINYFKQRVKNIFSSKEPMLQTNYLVQKPEAFSFSILKLYKWNEERIHEEICLQYTSAFTELIEDGWKPDIIHAQCTVDGGIIASHLGNVFKIPYLIIEHQVFLLHRYSKFKQQLMINSLQGANKVGAVSNHQKRCILMNSINCDPYVIWNFIDENKIQMKPAKSDLKFRIITISYPSFIKDMDTFFKSIERFSKVYNADIEIVVIGNDSFDDLNNANTIVFENLAKKYNVYAKCILIPYLSRNEISEVLNTANVFISTSIAETFGVAVREAMLCGVPVIVTKSGGVEDGVSDKTGVKVDIGDYQAISDALVKIKNNELKFDSAYIRDFTISQCGRNSFLKKMNDFYA